MMDVGMTRPQMNQMTGTKLRANHINGGWDYCSPNVWQPALEMINVCARCSLWHRSQITKGIPQDMDNWEFFWCRVTFRVMPQKLSGTTQFDRTMPQCHNATMPQWWFRHDRNSSFQISLQSWAYQLGGQPWEPLMSGLELAFVPLSGRPGLRQAWPLGAAPSARPEVAQRFSAGTPELFPQGVAMGGESLQEYSRITYLFLFVVISHWWLCIYFIYIYTYIHT